MNQTFYDCPCGGEGTVVLLIEETDTCKGVFNETPVYYKHCNLCKMEYVDDEVLSINSGLFKLFSRI